MAGPHQTEAATTGTAVVRKRRPLPTANQFGQPTVQTALDSLSQGSVGRLAQDTANLLRGRKLPDVGANREREEEAGRRTNNQQAQQQARQQGTQQTRQPPSAVPDISHEEQERLTDTVRRIPQARAITAEQHEAFMQGSCAYWAKNVLTGPVEYAGRFIIVEHHLQWDTIVTKEDRACVIAPRDHGKSQFFSFAYPLWRIFYKPKLKGMLFSATQEQAIRILDAIKQEIESNPKLMWLKPARAKNWSRTMIRCSNGAVLKAKGFGTRVRGEHPDFAIVDDGLNDESMYSEVARKRQKDFFYSALTNMVVPGGQIFVVGTPFHEADLYGELETNPAYFFKRFPALDPRTKQCLWPQRYSVKSLRKREKEIGTIRFSREFLCQAVSDAMSIFPGALFEGSPIEQPLVKLGMPLKWWQMMGVTIFCAVDIALSAGAKADWFVIWTVGVDASGNRWIVDIQRHQGLPYHRQKSMIVNIGRIYEPAFIGIESNQMQAVWGDELIRTTDLPIKKLITDKSKNSLEHGVPSIRTLLENNKYRIPRGDRRSVEITNVWKREMQSFTYVEGKLQGLGEHDDTVMACYLCERLIRKGAGAYVPTDEDIKATNQDVLEELTGTGRYADPLKELDDEDDSPITEPDASLIADANSDGIPIKTEVELVEDVDPFTGVPIMTTHRRQVASPMEGFGLPSG